ncbi:MAG: cobalamin B12-binding domain-containing protein, partial [Theionarchaea archaeon]|nr:cobalamin B12-binding domain-containing protein [Theionarchaea archaeon]
MILHSTLPYRQDIPNPALGYLKGFLQAQGIPVQAVYWNLILTRTLINLHRNLEKHQKESGLSSISGITLFLARHLLTGLDDESTPLSLLFSSVFTRQELSEIIHSLRNEIDQFIKMNKFDRASLSGFTLKSHQWPMSLYVINRLKSMNPDTKVVVGGIVNESQAQKFMNMIEADFAVWGEGEYPLYKLVKALEDGTPFEEVPQLVYRENGKIKVTKTLAECPPLDEYPFADHTDYFQTLKMGAPPQLTVLIPVWGSRSCPWNKCRFCVLNEGYQYRTRSPENIVKEIEYQSQNHKNDSFIFVDTELPGNRKRFTTLL